MKKILIIEDNADIRENIAELLELYGFKVATAENGRIGVERANEYFPDIIICDVVMPEKDGYQVISELRLTSGLKDVPFIFLTARSEKVDFQKGMQLGACSYITKPFDVEDLLLVIESLPVSSS